MEVKYVFVCKCTYKCLHSIKDEAETCVIEEKLNRTVNRGTGSLKVIAAKQEVNQKSLAREKAPSRNSLNCKDHFDSISR